MHDGGDCGAKGGYVGGLAGGAFSCQFVLDQVLFIDLLDERNDLGPIHRLTNTP